MLQPQMLGPSSAIDPSLHYVNIANQMQGLQIGNPAVSGYLSPQQWPLWPSGVGGQSTTTAGGGGAGGGSTGGGGAGGGATIAPAIGAKQSGTPQGTKHGANHGGYND